MTFKELIAKYLDGTISSAELAHLYELAESEYDGKEWDDALAGIFMQQAYAAEESDADKQEVFAALSAVIAAQEAPAAVPVRHIKRGWWRMAAAVLVLTAGCSVCWLLWPRKRDTRLAATQVLNAAPVKSGAILTLANGQQVLLDSLGNGMLDMQGDAVVKKEGGQISYQSRTGTPATAGTLYNSVATPRGRQFSLVLSDGTRVMLNAASSIRYPTVFTGAERKVYVTGEVYFDAARDVQHPFIAACSKGEVEVLGTRFMVTDYEEEPYTDATLLEGSIRVGKDNNKVLLKPAWLGRMERRTGKVQVQQADTSMVTAWMKGMLALNAADLKGTLRQISRWYDVDFVLPQKMPDVAIRGMLHRDVHLATVLEYLESSGIHYTTDQNRIVISP